eukprot:15435628-Alexandrium_andersonii.AAC.1
MGWELKPTIFNDASAVLANAAKLGPGRMRHLEVQSLFVKEAVRKRRVRSVKETSQKNVPDVFAKK